MTLHYLQIKFYAWLVNLIKKMHVQIIYHRIKNNAYSYVCLNKRIFFRNTFHEKLIHFKLHGICTT